MFVFLHMQHLTYLNEFKTILFAVDLLNTLTSQSVAASGTTSRLPSEICFVLFTVFLGVATLGALIAKLIYDNCTSKVSSNKKTPCGILLYTLANIVALLFVWSYYVGDNLDNYIRDYGDRIGCNATDSTNQCAKASHLFGTGLLVFGILGFRFIPVFELKVKRIMLLRKEKRNEAKEKATDQNAVELKNVNAEAKNGTDDTDLAKRVESITTGTKFYNIGIEIIGTIPEVDGWYTALTEIIDISSVACSTADFASNWLIYALLLTLLTLNFILTVIHFKYDFWKEKFYTLLLLLIVIVSVLISGVYILADNAQPLNCVFGCEPNQSIRECNAAVARLVFVVVCALLYIVALGLVGIPILRPRKVYV